MKRDFPWQVLATCTVMIGTLGMVGCNKPASETPAPTTESKTETTTVAPTEPTTAKSLRIATEGAYPPFNYMTSDGKLAGFDVDVVNAVCAQMKAKCEIVAQDWDGILPGLMTKKYDAVAAGMSITPDRLEKVDFTTPYFTNTMVWLAKKDSGFDPANITGKKLGSQRSTTLGEYLEKNFDKKNGNEVNLYESYDNAYLELTSGRVDAVLAEKVSAILWLKDNPDFAIIGDPIDNDDQIAIAVRKGDPLKNEMNTALEAIRANGELAKLEQANFGQ